MWGLLLLLCTGQLVGSARAVTPLTGVVWGVLLCTGRVAAVVQLSGSSGVADDGID